MFSEYEKKGEHCIATIKLPSPQIRAKYRKGYTDKLGSPRLKKTIGAFNFLDWTFHIGDCLVSKPSAAYPSLIRKYQVTNARSSDNLSRKN